MKNAFRSLFCEPRREPWVVENTLRGTEEMKFKYLVAAAVLSIPVLPMPVAASLIGDSVQGDLQIAGGNSVLATCPNQQRLNVSQNFASPATVDATGVPEFTGTIGVCDGNQQPTITDLDWSVDVQDSRLVYTMGVFERQGDFSVAILLEDLNWVDVPGGVITGLSVVQDDIGLTNSIFGPNNVSVAFTPDFPSAITTTTIIDLQVDHDDVPVPVPATFGLMVSGLALLAWRRGRGGRRMFP